MVADVKEVPVTKKELKPLVTPVKKFSDVYDASTPWEGTHKTIQGKLIQINKATKIDTSYGPAFLCDVKIDDEMRKILIGGKVLVTQLEKLQLDLPIEATIVKRGRYYTFE
jgi:hypothetical protein